MVEAKGRSTRIEDELKQLQAEIEALRQDGAAINTDKETLIADIQSLEQEVAKLRAETGEQSGKNARSFVGAGNRQYLTGLNLGGKNIAILVDVSSSMLAPELVNIIRLRNM